MACIAERVQLCHVEVETVACIGSVQKLCSEVKALLEQFGFVELATDQLRSASQFNALFVRSDLSVRMQFRAKACLVLARLRYLLVRAIRVSCELASLSRHAGPGFVTRVRASSLTAACVLVLAQLTH
jgi:hypothetical protein